MDSRQFSAPFKCANCGQDGIRVWEESGRILIPCLPKDRVGINQCGLYFGGICPGTLPD
jgi:hypothetical protein